MINGFLIQGFKPFDLNSTEYLPIRPITLLFGQNAAGKSSLLQALAWMHHIHHGGSVDAHRMALTGPNANLGGFKTLRHRKSRWATKEYIDWHDVEVGWSFHFPETVKSMGYVPDSNMYLNTKFTPYEWGIIYKIGDERDEKPLKGGPAIKSVTICCGAVEVTWKYNEDEDFFWTSGLGDIRGGEPQSCLDWVIGEDAGKVDIEGFKKEVDDQLCFLDFSLHGVDASRPGLAPFLSEFQAEKLSEPARLFLSRFKEVVDLMAKDIDEFLKSMNYLGPWRRIPDEADLARITHSTDEPELKYWGRLLVDKSLRERVNKWLERFGCDVEVKASGFLNRDLILCRIEELYEKYEDKEDFYKNLKWKIEDEASATPERLTLQAPGRGIYVNPENTGVGISQLTPILVAALTGEKERLLIEQPELHLHPKLQAELGDLLIQATVAKDGPNHCLIVETHSEHLILRLLRRIRETADPRTKVNLNPEDLSIVYIGRKSLFRDESLQEIKDRQESKNNVDLEQKVVMIDAQCPTRITPLPVNSDGDFDVKWPEGFFEDRMKEIFSAEELENWHQEP